jgi:hypothetical protein
VLVVCETTSELEMCDLDHPIICQCRKHRQLARQEGGFVVCFPSDILMVHSSTLIVAADGERLMCRGISLSETICFGSLEFIADCVGGMSVSLMGATHALSSWSNPQRVAVTVSHDRGLS